MIIRSVEDNAKERTTEFNDDGVKGKVVRNARLARQILHAGGKDVWLFDVKPDRDDKNRTVFLFEDTEKFQEIFASIIEENRRNRKETADEEIQKQIDERVQKGIEEAKEQIIAEAMKKLYESKE